MVEGMTEREFEDTMRRAALMILGALVKRYGRTWLELLPKHVTAPPIYSATVSTPAPEYGGGAD
jgi:hypothetical protein